jgi:diadenosine tetraphosphate (Ap4A) HIT family hydrolase
MVEDFELDSRLRAAGPLVTDWPLCQLRLRDDRRFPWLLLIPRRAGIVELTDLDPDDYRALCVEIRAAVELLRALLQPDKTNVATLGNQVAQLHVHVIARFHGDAAWPDPVWGKGEAEPYPVAERDVVVARIAAAAGRAPGSPA